MISILCPTRERPRNLNRMLASILATATSHALPEIVLYMDDDDRSFTSAKAWRTEWWPHSRFTIITGKPGEVMSNMWNRCAERATGDVLMFVDDEALFDTTGWDALIEAEFERWPDRAVLVHGDDGVHGQILASYFFVHRRWVEIFGRLTPRQFTYGYADVWCSEVAAAAGRKIYLPNVVIENMAPKDQPPDHIHQANAARAERDRPGDLYNATQAEREADVRALRAYIDSWSQR